MVLTSLLLLISAAGKDCWRQGAKDQLTSVGLSSRCRGLWGECVHDNMVGLRTCDVSVSYMEHLPGSTVVCADKCGVCVFSPGLCAFPPADMLAMRVALVGTCVLTGVSLIIMIPSLRWTTLIPSALAQRRLLQVSGAVCLCGGVCGAVGLLWYGANTYTRYRQDVSLGMPGITFEFGLSYWLTVGSVLCCLTSAVMTIGSGSRISDVIRIQPRFAHNHPANTRVMFPQTYI